MKYQNYHKDRQKKEVNQVYWKRIRTGIGIIRCLFILSEIRRKEIKDEAKSYS